ncbi:MAG: hypothetical protein H3C38_00175 [Rhodospirillales bacterium]|nr:hypothetical protein [Rhodospirillales bacterium]
MMRSSLLALFLSGVLATPAFADAVTDRIDRAFALYRDGALADAAIALGAAALDVQTRLGNALAEVMPTPPDGWQAGAAHVSAMGPIGGLTVSRDYRGADGVMDAAVVVGSPAVAGVASLIGEPGVLATQPGLRLVRLGDRDALLRWEPSTRSGQVMTVLGQTVLVQVVGRGVADGEELVALMRAWDLSAVAARAGVAEPNGN